MRFRSSSIVGHMAASNRDEVPERLVKVSTANKHKMKYRLHFRNNNKMEEMHKTVSEQMPTTFLKASDLNPLHRTSVFFIPFSTGDMVSFNSVGK